MPQPPVELHSRGELPRGPSVAIVGTRHPTDEAVAFTHRIAGELVRQGVAILSGGAEGIDTAAHEGALAAGGVTVVVAPAGYLAPFPEKNAALFAEIVARGGAYVSAVPESQVARRGAFFRRNGCLVALAHALVVVQCPVRSGALNAAAWARRLGRPLLVVPSSPWISQGRGCIGELRRGALVCESAKSILRVLQAGGLGTIRPSVHPPLLPPPLTPEAAGTAASRADVQGELFPLTAEGDVASAEVLADRVLAAIQAGAGHPDELCQGLRESAARINEALLTLRLRGALVPGPLGGLLFPTQRKR